LIDSGRVPVVRLETVHRQAQKSWVFRNAPRILAGDEATLELEGSFEDFSFYEETDPARLGAALIEIYQEELERVERRNPEWSETKLLDAVQILIPQRVGPLGTTAINQQIQRAIHGDMPAGTGFQVNNDLTLFDGDKVIQTRNNYTLGVMNGETGVVRGRSDGRLFVEVADEEITFTKHDAQDLLLGYAVTIHKSQGSEWPTVIVVCHSAHGRMLNRQLLYTAITRARGRLVILGDRKGIERAMRIEMVSNRQTRLKERLDWMLEK
jgi:exodeoxyribonuclease V alpha subunit